MRNVWNPEQHVGQIRRHLVVFGGEGLLGGAERPALVLERRGTVDIAVAAELTDLLGDRVDARPDLITLGGDRAQALVEAGGVFDLVDERRTGPPGDRGPQPVGVGAQESLVDHERRLPVAHRRPGPVSPVRRPGQDGESTGSLGSVGATGVPANSRSTSRVVSGDSSWPVISASGMCDARR